MSESRSIEIKLKQTSTGETETIYITQEGKEFVPEYVFTIDEEQRTRAAIQSGDRDVMLGLLKSYKTIESGGTDTLDWTLDDDSVRGDGADLDVYVGYGYGSYQYVYVMLESVNEDPNDKTIYFTIVQEESGKTLDFTVTIKGKEVDTNPKWTSTGELGCSSSSSSYREKTDIYADGYAFVKYRDTNPDSSSYNDTEWRRASNRDDECVGQADTSPKWEYVDSSSYGCSSNSYSFNEKTDPYADGYAFRLQKDTNPDSDTYGDTKWVRYSSWDSKCKGKTLECTLSVKPSSISFNIDGSSAGASDINATSRDTISYHVNEACSGSVTVKYDTNLDSKYSSLISISNNENVNKTSGETTVLLTSDSKKIFLNNKLPSHAANMVYTYDDQTIRVPIYVNVTNRPSDVSYTFESSETFGILNNVGDTKSFTITSVKNLNGNDSFTNYDYTVSDNISKYITIDTRASSESAKRELVVKYETELQSSDDLIGIITLTQKESGKKILISIKVNPVQSVGYDCTIISSTSEVRFNIPRYDLSGQFMIPQTFTASLPGECPSELTVEYNPSVDYGSVSVNFNPSSISSTRKEYTVNVHINDIQEVQRRMNMGVDYVTLGYITLDVTGPYIATSNERRVSVYAQLV